MAGLMNAQNIIALADVAFTSCTKYISGHNDVIGGLTLVKTDDFFKSLWDERSTHGTLLDAFSSFLLLRSLRTYDLRISKMLENTKACLDLISISKNVDHIFYPGIFQNKLSEVYIDENFSHGGSVITFHLNRNNFSRKDTACFRSIKMAPLLVL